MKPAQGWNPDALAVNILVLQNLHKMGSDENHDQLRSKDNKEVDWLVSGLCFIARALFGMYSVHLNQIVESNRIELSVNPAFVCFLFIHRSFGQTASKET